MIGGTAGLATGSWWCHDPRRSVGAAAAPPDPPVRCALNTSTIRGQDVGLVGAIELARDAGFDGIEPWIREIEAYQKAGGSLLDLRHRIEDAGLEVVGAIGFAPWIAEDDARRRAALEQARREMALVAQIGGTPIAALVEVGKEEGVEPQLELWGFAKTLGTLPELLYVAAACGEAAFGILLDVYHLHKGGTSWHALNLLAGSMLHVFHVNDYPKRPREALSDADRVFPGDGVAPLPAILKTLHQNGFRGTLSLELFNPTYWKRDAAAVCREGLRKLREQIELAARRPS